MKRIIIVLFIGSINIYSQSANYPLHIGDTWQYQYFTIPFVDSTVYSYRVISDTIIDNKSYMIIASLNYYQSSDIVRQAGDSVINFQNNREIVYYNFSKSINDTVSSTPFENDTMDIALIGIDSAKYFGVWRKEWRFGINRLRHAVDDEYSVSIVDSLGIVEITPSFGDRLILVGALINGKTYGRITGVSRKDKDVPEQFSLFQNYPNPFNPTTTIKFTLIKSSNVSVNIYNAVGQVIRVYPYSSLSSGNHEIIFDGSIYSSGVYYFRINTEYGNKAIKMILQK